MLTRTSEYALQALIYLAKHVEDWPVSGKRIAEATGVPRKYLSKVLADLVRVNVLESARGKSGGFRLVRSAETTSLFEVLSPFEPFPQQRCPFGNEQCSDENPCIAHTEWKKVLETEQQFLEGTFLSDVATERRSGVPARRDSEPSGRAGMRKRRNRKP